MKTVIVTGAGGFIGMNLCKRLLDMGYKVIGVDNLSRVGSERNIEELLGTNFTLYRIDLSSAIKVDDLFKNIGSVDAVFHLAAQVAVTTSYINRKIDFLDNAYASFNIIESIKQYSPDAYCLYASTNKVYGHLKVEKPVDITFPLNPYTPYGVSKAVGEMYFTEYGRKEIGLSTCSLRQSCIYGHHQYGVEDQGWIAWFSIANLLKRPITIYGDGAQVRDLLFIDDLIDLYLECMDKRLTGVYPVGGGDNNSINLLEGLEIIRTITGKNFTVTKDAKFRPGDQPYFVANIDWVKSKNINWQPKINVQNGIKIMIDWIIENLSTIRKVNTTC